MELRQRFVEVWLNDVLKCTEARADRRTFENVVVYASDPWHDAALATVDNFYFAAAEEFAGCIDPDACNKDDRATQDDGTCTYPADARKDCNGNALQTVGDKTYFIYQNPTQLDKEIVHNIVALPTDFTIGIDITPGDTMTANWGNILHFTATGNNCCDYGDRIPGIWFHPGTRNLHIRDGHGGDGSVGCDP